MGTRGGTGAGVFCRFSPVDSLPVCLDGLGGPYKSSSLSSVSDPSKPGSGLQGG